MRIGFFDSGLGGLTILKAVTIDLPQYDYVFLGDTKNLPYGDKTEEQIYEFTKVGIEELFRRGCILAIIACNTASAETLRKLQESILVGQWQDRRILGVIIPTVEALIGHGSKNVLMIATQRTVSSGKYERELASRSSTLLFRGVATPTLVPLIEDGNVDKATAMAIEVIDGICVKDRTIDTIVLGCTHYTKLKDGLRAHCGVGVRVFSQDEIIPARVAWYLGAHPEIKERLTMGGTRTIILTEHRADYDHIAGELLGGTLIS